MSRWRRRGAAVLVSAVLAGAGTGCHASASRPGALASVTPAATMSAPTQPVVPVTILARMFEGLSESLLLASTDVNAVSAQAQKLGRCDTTCFAGVTAPAQSLLVAVQPARDSGCGPVGKPDARMAGPTDLVLVFTLIPCGPVDAPPAPQDLLLSLPLASLPQHVTLTVEATAVGDPTEAMAPASTAITLP